VRQNSHNHLNRSLSGHPAWWYFFPADIKVQKPEDSSKDHRLEAELLTLDHCIMSFAAKIKKGRQNNLGVPWQHSPRLLRSECDPVLVYFPWPAACASFDCRGFFFASLLRC
jgi:hypothetical protein